MGEGQMGRTYQRIRLGDAFPLPFLHGSHIAAITLLIGYFSDLHFLWWAFFGWLSVSYLAAMLVARDGGGD